MKPRFWFGCLVITPSCEPLYGSRLSSVSPTANYLPNEACALPSQLDARCLWAGPPFDLVSVCVIQHSAPWARNQSVFAEDGKEEDFNYQEEG